MKNECEKYEIVNRVGNNWHIHFNEPQESLCKGLLMSDLLQGAAAHEHYKTISFYAKKVETLREKAREMQYSDFVHLGECIGVQIFYLEQIGWTFYGLCLDNIVVVDDNVYIYIGASHLAKIYEKEDKTIYFTSPFKKQGNGGNGGNGGNVGNGGNGGNGGNVGKLFLSSEIMSISILPASVDYRCVYSSLGELLLYLINGNSDNRDNRDNRDNENGLESIRETKLYWFIHRCIYDKIMLFL